MGWGRPYLKHRSRMWRNQDPQLSLPEMRMCEAILCRILLGNLEIIEKRESCFRCSLADAGKDPEKK